MNTQYIVVGHKYGPSVQSCAKVSVSVVADSGKNVELAVHLWVHRRRDDLHAGEHVGDRVDAQLGSKHGDEEDPLLRHIMILTGTDDDEKAQQDNILI